MRKLIFLAILLFLFAAVFLRMSLYTVDASEWVYVTQLGRHIDTLDGSSPDEAGLHFGWPWPFQTVRRLDRRLQFFDLDSAEHLTRDPKENTIDKTLSVQAYVCWRIPNEEAVDLFIRHMGNTDQARNYLNKQINSQLGGLIGKRRMDDLISTEPSEADPTKTKAQMNLEQMQRTLKKSFENTLDKYGIELVDVRLRRFNHPAQVRDAIFQRIRSEREKKVTELRSAGKRAAQNILSEAEEFVRTKLAEARYKETVLKGEGETEAVKIRNQAHAADPEFYAFLKKMEKLKSILGDNKTVLLLSSHRPIFDLLFSPPRVDGQLQMPEKQKSKQSPKGAQ